MALTSTQTALLRETFRGLQDDPERKSVYFYEELFRLDPSLRPMFRDDLSGQGMRFMSTLATIIENIDQPDEIASRFEDLGHGHRSLGVKAENFDTMQRALIATLRHFLGDGFGAAAETAWNEAFRQIARAIIAAGGIPKG